MRQEKSESSTSSLNLQTSAKIVFKFGEISISSLNFSHVHQNGPSVQKVR